MLQVPGKLKIQRESIVELLNQLTDDYVTLEAEMKKIFEQSSDSEDEFTFLEEFELLIVSVSGYAKQIQATGNVKQLDSATVHLQQLQVFANLTIAQFHMETRGQYPKVQNYLQMLDYLRLLILEYLQMQQTIQPISA